MRSALYGKHLTTLRRAPLPHCWLHRSFVRTIQDHSHSVWQPHHNMLCSDVEGIQWQATRLLSHLKDKPSSGRLRHLNLPTLKHWRRRGDLVLAHKYISGIYQVTKTPSSQWQLILRHVAMVSKIRSSFFSARVVTNWNSPPEEVVTMPCVSSFKACLDAHQNRDPPSSQ